MQNTNEMSMGNLETNAHELINEIEQNTSKGENAQSSINVSKNNLGAKVDSLRTAMREKQLAWTDIGLTEAQGQRMEEVWKSWETF